MQKAWTGERLLLGSLLCVAYKHPNTSELYVTKQDGGNECGIYIEREKTFNKVTKMYHKSLL